MTLGWCCRGCDFGRPCHHGGGVNDNVYARTLGVDDARKLADTPIDTYTNLPKFIGDVCDLMLDDPVRKALPDDIKERLLAKVEAANKLLKERHDR